MEAEFRIPRGTPESNAMRLGVERAMALTERINLLRYDQLDDIRTLWAELTGQPVDPTFALIPPVYSDCGANLRIGQRVFINQGCSLNDIGGIEIGDEVMIGPGVRLLSSGHPVSPSERRLYVTAAPIRIGRNVWIGAGASVLQGVTVGDDSVIAAGAVVTRDVPSATLVAGVPARVVRSIADE